MATTTARASELFTRYLLKPLGALATAGLLATFSLYIAVHYPGATPVTAILGLVIISIAIWMVLNERYEWSLVVLMLYLGLADGYLKLSTGSSSITLVRDMLLYAIVVGILARMAIRRETAAFPPLAGWIVAWVVIVLVQLFNPSNGTAMHSIAAVRPHAEYVPLFFLAYFILRSKARIRNFLLLLVAIAAINGVVGLIQSNLSPEELSAWGPGYSRAINGEGDEGTTVSARNFSDSSGEEHNRPFGLGGDSGFGGIVGMLAVPAALALLALSRQRGIRILTALLSIGVVLAVATSTARTAVLGSAIAVFAFAALTVTSRAGMRTVFAVGLTVTVVYAGAGILTSSSEEGSFDRFSSISSPGKAVGTYWDYRKQTLANVPKYAVDYPLGSGLGRNGPAASRPGGPDGPGLDAESEPTFLLIELGIPGLIVMIGLFVSLFYLSITRIRKIEDREARILLTALAAPLFAIFATGFVGITSAGGASTPYFWFAAGALAFWLAGEGFQDLTRSTDRSEAADGDLPASTRISRTPAL